MTSASETAFIARQPILDAAGQISAYELLFRSAIAPTAGTILDDVYATSRVLVNGIAAVGIDRLLGNRKAFINCSWRALQEGVVDNLDPERFVLEILETSEPDPQLLEDAKRLRKLGFELALDDFVYTAANVKAWAPFFPLVQWVKVDLRASTKQQCIDAATYFTKLKGPGLLAEKVETREEFELYKKCGYTLFQGWFFAKPEVLTARSLDPSATGILGLMQKVRADLSTETLEDEFKHQPELTMSLLRFLNSAAFGMRREVNSVKQAITILGRHKLQQWLMLLLYSKPGPNGGNTVVYANALWRARFMELLCKKLTGSTSKADQAFLCGLLSRLDAITGVPIPELLKTFPVDPEIQDAILSGKGLMGSLLELINETERDKTSVLHTTLGSIKLQEGDFREALLESYSWAESFGTALG